MSTESELHPNGDVERLTNIAYSGEIEDDWLNIGAEMGYEVTVSTPRPNGTLFGIQPNRADDGDCTYYFQLKAFTPL